MNERARKMADTLSALLDSVPGAEMISIARVEGVRVLSLEGESDAAAVTIGAALGLPALREQRTTSGNDRWLSSRSELAEALVRVRVAGPLTAAPPPVVATRLDAALDGVQAIALRKPSVHLVMRDGAIACEDYRPGDRVSHEHAAITCGECRVAIQLAQLGAHLRGGA